MSEILGEQEVREISDRHRFHSSWYVQDICKLIASHRALQAENDAYKSSMAQEMAENVKLFDLLGVHEEIKAGTAGTEAVIKAVKLLMQERDALKAELAAKEQLYHELLYQVGMKYPNESRHETALRYLKRAEQQANGPSQCAKEAQP